MTTRPPPRPARLGAAISAAMFGVVLLAPGPAVRADEARSWRVPRDRPTLQAAIDDAAPGDEIRVAPGRHCGASVDKRLRLTGEPGAILVGCPGGPTLHQTLRVGLLLGGPDGRDQEAATGNPATGSVIRGFTFDGAGVSADNLDPLAFAVYARLAHDVEVSDNRVRGTVQAITNTGGDGWRIRGNVIEGLGILAGPEGTGGGGAGIVIQAAGPEDRPARSLILHNRVQGRAPDGFTAFAMSGILVLSADATLVLGNQVAVHGGPPAAPHAAAGVLLTHTCCGAPDPAAGGTRLSGILLNDAAGSDLGVVVEGRDGANTSGLFLLGNDGELRVEPDAAGDLEDGRRD